MSNRQHEELGLKATHSEASLPVPEEAPYLGKKTLTIRPAIPAMSVLDEKKPDLYRVLSHASTHDMPAVSSLEPSSEKPDLHRNLSLSSSQDSPSDMINGVPAHEFEIYHRFSHTRTLVMVSILSYCSFLSPMASTAILSAVPELAASYNTTGTVINISNAVYCVFMGLAGATWGPFSQVYGRRWPLVLSGICFTATSIGCALAPNLVAFFAFRAIMAYTGTSFLIIGSSCIGDLYHPTERATAMSWFFSGTLIGPALAPFIAGIIITYRSWHDIFWLQAGLSALANVLCIFFLSETIHQKRSSELQNLSRREYAVQLWRWTSPLRIVGLFRYPNLFAVYISASALVWNMYSLLTPIRYVIDPRFNLDSPLQAGLFYLAPGCGYILGTFFGGRWADRTVKKYIKLRGRRVPEDRLNSCIPFLGVVIPACMIVYGWSLEKRVGGVPLPVIVMFLQGVAQLFCFPSINSYCLDVMQKRSAEAVAGSYLLRYIFAAVSTAVCLPAIDAIGVGWFSTISAAFLVASAVAVWATARWGESWRQNVEGGDK